MEKKSSKNTWIIATFIIVLLVVLAISGVFNSTSNTSKDINKLNPINMNSLIDDDSIKGDPNAPITIIEFSDYECPFCQRFYLTTYQQIVENYIDTGKVNLVYRDFPLSFHQNAQKAAEAAECAGEQGKYYEMHDLLFEKGVEGGIDSFKNYASEIGLNQAEFDECLDSGKMESEVKKDFADGQTLGISGTPSFIINGKILVGAQPYSVFEKEIEAELKKLN